MLGVEDCLKSVSHVSISWRSATSRFKRESKVSSSFSKLFLLFIFSLECIYSDDFVINKIIHCSQSISIIVKRVSLFAFFSS